MCKRLGLFTVIVVLMFSAIPFTIAESDCDYSYSNQARGEQLFAMGDYLGALPHFECALAQDPDSQSLLLTIGNIYGYIGDRANATAYYEHATGATTLNQSCDIGISQFAYGAQLYARGELGHALEAYQCALSQEPENILHMKQLVMIYIELEQHDQALTYLDRALQIDDTDAVLYSRRGYVHYLMENLNQALSDLDTALDLDPTLYSALETRSQVLTAQGILTNTTCDTSLSPLVRGAQLYAMGELGNALEAYRCGLTQEPDSMLYLMEVVLVYIELEQYDQALMYLNRAVQMEDNNPIVYSRRGYVHYLSGNLNEALVDVNVALELNPTLYSALETRELILTALGEVETVSVDSPISKNPLPQLDSDLADTSTQMTVAEVAPSSPTAETLRQAAENFFNSYEFEQAILQYEALLAFEPDNAFAHYRIGYAYYALENPAQGLVYLQQAEALNPDHLYTQYFLAMSYSMLDMSQDALTTMSNIYEAYPYDGAFPIAMGQVYRNLGHNEAAAAEFNLWLEQHQLLRLDTVTLKDHAPTPLAMDYGVVYEIPFYGIAGNDVQIAAESSILNRKAVDPLIVVLNADGVPIAGDDDSGDLFDARLTFLPPSTEYYTLLISHAGGNSTGELNVTLSGEAWSADTYRAIAQNAMDLANYPRVLEMLDRAIALDGGIYEDYMMRARAYLQLEDYVNTINAYHLALDLTTSPAAVYAEIGRVYRMMEDWDSAAMAYSQALEADPMLDHVRCQLGMIYAMWGDYDDAIRQFDMILMHNQTDSCAWSNRRATLRLMREPNVLNDLSAAPAQLSPASDLADLGYQYLDQNKKFAAAFTFLDALAIDPTLDQVRCDLGLIYSGWGNHLGALEQFDQVQSNPCADANRARVIEKMESFFIAESTKYTTSTAPAQPSPADDLVSLAYDYLAQNKKFSAANTFFAALQVDPSMDTIRCELSKIHIGWGNYVSAMNQLKRVSSHPCAAEHLEAMKIKHSRIYEPMTAQDYVNMGQDHVAEEEWGAAIDDYQQALRIDPTRADVRCELDNLAYRDFLNYDNSMSHYEAIFKSTNVDCTLMRENMNQTDNHRMPRESVSSITEVDTLYETTVTMGTQALFHEAQTRHENGEIWLASALLDRYIDENFATTCAGELRWLSDEYREAGYGVAANMLYLKALVDVTC